MSSSVPELSLSIFTQYKSPPLIVVVAQSPGSFQYTVPTVAEVMSITPATVSPMKGNAVHCEPSQ